MLERLLENWLDSASERSYQAVFVQMLAAKGYTVLHSTRHCLLEYGKDILAIAPDGVGCAFQLKGDPGGRMKISEFRKDIQPQLVQLMAQTPSYPGFPTGVHRAYLVSNGQFEEEVQIAVREMNAGPYPAKAELWSRGHLFEMCKSHAAALWPSELKDNRALLEIYLADPKEPLQVKTLAGMLGSILGLGTDQSLMANNQLERAASSAAWLTGISTAPYAEQGNHLAVISAWSLCCTLLIAASGKHADFSLIQVGASLEIARNSLLDSLAALWEEVSCSKNLIEGDAFTDSEIVPWRLQILYGLLSGLAIADAKMSLLDHSSQCELIKWLKTSRGALEIWGEAAVANLVPWLVWLRKSDATNRPDAEIGALARIVVGANQDKSTNPLPSPYYNFETVMQHYLSLEEVVGAGSLESEAIAGNSYTAEALLHLLVRTNLKSQCKALWSQFSKICHHRLDFDEKWHYCLFDSPLGVNVSKIYPLTYEWGRLKNDALIGDGEEEIPCYLQENPWLLALWWQVAPYRMTPNAVRIFAEKLLPGWGS